MVRGGQGGQGRQGRQGGQGRKRVILFTYYLLLIT